MLNDSQKTIPYTQSAAELEQLRLMRKTARFFSDLENAKEATETSPAVDERNSDSASGTATTNTG